MWNMLYLINGRKKTCKPDKRLFHRSNKPDAKSATNFSVRTFFFVSINSYIQIRLFLYFCLQFAYRRVCGLSCSSFWHLKQTIFFSFIHFTLSLTCSDRKIVIRDIKYWTWTFETLRNGDVSHEHSICSVEHFHNGSMHLMTLWHESTNHFCSWSLHQIVSCITTWLTWCNNFDSFCTTSKFPIKKNINNIVCSYMGFSLWYFANGKDFRHENDSHRFPFTRNSVFEPLRRKKMI